jgi:hypothetical protein
MTGEAGTHVRRTIFAAVPLAVLALAAPAAAKSGHATTYKAKLVAVEAAPAATATKHGAKVRETGIRGHAELVDGKRRDKVQLQVKGLEAGAAYTWSVRSATGEGDACAGEAVDAFQYGDMTARRKGNSRARSRSREFTAEDGTSYAVVVTDAEGVDVACGQFLSKADRRAAKKKAGKAHGKAKHDEQGDDDAQGDDDSQAGGDDQAEDPATEPEPGDDPAGDDDPEVED